MLKRLLVLTTHYLNIFPTYLPHNFKLAEILNFPEQNSFRKDKGYINLKFHDKNDAIKSDEFYNNQMLSNITDLVSRGYSYKDICIIVRKKKEGNFNRRLFNRK